jgi:hypothetical protein
LNPLASGAPSSSRTSLPTRDLRKFPDEFP